MLRLRPRTSISFRIQWPGILSGLPGSKRPYARNYLQNSPAVFTSYRIGVPSTLNDFVTHRPLALLRYLSYGLESKMAISKDEIDTFIKTLFVIVVSYLCYAYLAHHQVQLARCEASTVHPANTTMKEPHGERLVVSPKSASEFGTGDILVTTRSWPGVRSEILAMMPPALWKESDSSFVSLPFEVVVRWFSRLRLLCVNFSSLAFQRKSNNISASAFCFTTKAPAFNKLETYLKRWVIEYLANNDKEALNRFLAYSPEEQQLLYVQLDQYEPCGIVRQYPRLA